MSRPGWLGAALLAGGLAVGLGLIALTGWLDSEAQSAVDSHGVVLREAAPSEPKLLVQPVADRAPPESVPEPVAPTPAQNLSGRVEQDLEVQVASGPCALAEDLELRLRRVADGWSDRRTGRGPSLRWSRLPPGDYVVEVSALTAKRWAAKPLAVTLRGERPEVAVEFSASARSRTSGRVRVGTGAEPPPEVTLRLQSRRIPPDDVRSSFPESTLVVTLDAEGRFCVEGWSLVSVQDFGEWRLVVDAPGYQPCASPWTSEPMLGQVWLEDFEFVLERPAIVSGRVVSARGGEPLYCAPVRLVPVGGESDTFQVFDVRRVEQASPMPSDGPQIVSGETRAEGRFELTSAAPAVVRLRVFEAASVPWESEPFELRPGDHREFEVVLQPGARIEGRVTVLGEPDFTVVHVVVTPAAEGFARGVFSSEVDDQGRFAVGALPAGAVTLVVLGALDEYSTIPVHEESMVLAPGETRWIDVTLTPPPSGRLEGTVIAPRELPLFAALLDGDTGLLAGQPVSVEDGRFSLPVPSTGSFVCAVTSRPQEGDLWLAAQPVPPLPAGSTHAVLLDLTSSALTLDGRPGRVSEVRVEPFLEHGALDVIFAEPLAQLVLGSTGRFVIHGLPPGRYRVSRQPVPGAEGQAPAPLDVVLTAGGSVVARLD